MKIVKLTSENVKRLSAVEITPAGNLVVIGGKNGQGKSSVLDSIIYALGGDPDVKMPVRRGEEKAKVVVDLGDIIVKRTFTAAGGTSLVVTNADGARQSSPQAILDGLIGKLTFDPLDFARQKPEKQSETLRVLVGLDFAAADAKAAEIFTIRTGVNREVKQLESRLAVMPRHDGLPEEEQSAAEILQQQETANAKNRANEKLRSDANVTFSRWNDAKSNATEIEGDIASEKQRIEEIRQELIAAEKRLAEFNVQLTAVRNSIPDLFSAHTQAKAAADAATDIDLSTFRTKIAEVEQTNRKIREAKQRAELVKQLKSKSEEAERLTGELDKLDRAKRKATTAAKYPVDGLLFDTAGGIVLNGIPFDQCSSAEQLKVSVAIGFALNPKLKIILIRDGSLLDDASMETLCQMAESAKAQVWIERVGTDGKTSVVIDDGHIAEGELL